MDLISIIIPLYNKSETISYSIKSILAQTYCNWELIIVDDGSVDNSAEIVHSFDDKRIIYFYTENAGVSAARNYGVEHAKGKWIIYLDADDCFINTALEKLHQTAKVLNVEVVVGNFYKGMNDGRNLLICAAKSQKIIRNNFESWYLGLLLPRPGSIMIKCSVSLKFFHNIYLKRNEDLEYVFNLLRNYKIGYTPDPVMIYSQNSLGLSTCLDDIHADFLSCMNFTNKNIWERIVYLKLLNYAYKLYPKERSFLTRKYGVYNLFRKFEYVIRIYCLFLKKIQF